MAPKMSLIDVIRVCLPVLSFIAEGKKKKGIEARLDSCVFLRCAGDPSVLDCAGLEPVQRGGGAQWLPGDHQLHQPAAG